MVTMPRRNLEVQDGANTTDVFFIAKNNSFCH